MDDSTIGGRINGLRTARGMTLRELGDKIGVGASTVRKWETGYIRYVKADKIAKLASALNTTTEYLMGWEDGTAHDVTASLEEQELLRIYRLLDARRRTQLMSRAFELEDSMPE